MVDKVVDSYILIRRATGCGLKYVEPLLRNFADFAESRNQDHIVARTAIEWAGQSQSPFERDRRLKTVIRLARYGHAEDSRHEIPPDGVFGKQAHRRPVPFIFTGDEIRRLMESASRHRLRNTLVPRTYSTLFGLLAATGLRVSEAFNLRMDDIAPDGLVIRETKFHKTRMVPLHETTTAALERYIATRRLVGTEENYIFISLRGSRLCYQSVCKFFHSCLLAAGIQRQGHRPKPRLHSFRHTFVVRALESCPVDKNHINRHMLALSTYLGHSSMESTFWYLEATPQLLCSIAGAWDTLVWGGAQ
jgi:integrase/recombinase XerD